MARSTYVYVLARNDGAVTAAFTVKRELERYLAIHKYNPNKYHVTRYRDGVPYSSFPMGVGEDYNQVKWSKPCNS